jgi:hypothetical protein
MGIICMERKKWESGKTKKECEQLKRTSVHVFGVRVAAVDFDVVDVPRGEGLRVQLQWAQDAGVTGARVVAVILVNAELQT